MPDKRPLARPTEEEMEEREEEIERMTRGHFQGDEQDRMIEEQERFERWERMREFTRPDLPEDDG